MTSKFFFEGFSKIYRITYRITPKKMTFNKWKAIKSTRLSSLRRFLIYLYSTFGSLRLSSCKEKGNFLINFQYFPCHLLSLESWLRFLEEYTIQYNIYKNAWKIRLIRRMTRIPHSLHRMKSFMGKFWAMTYCNTKWLVTPLLEFWKICHLPNSIAVHIPLDVHTRAI